jgi:hypothetical protein
MVNSKLVVEIHGQLKIGGGKKRVLLDWRENGNRRIRRRRRRRRRRKKKKKKKKKVPHKLPRHAIPKFSFVVFLGTGFAVLR